MNKFTLGAISGISALALAVPVVAQIAAAQGTTDSSASIAQRMRPPLTQENIQGMVDRDNALLGNVDAMVTLFKGATATHRDALVVAAAMTDDAARQAAVKAANDARRTTVEDAMKANPNWKMAMPFGMGKGPHGLRGHGPMGGKFAEKLGMTPEELKAAIDSGKTIEQIAQDKGITLPPHPFGRHMHGEKDADGDDDGDL